MHIFVSGLNISPLFSNCFHIEPTEKVFECVGWQCSHKPILFSASEDLSGGKKKKETEKAKIGKQKGGGVPDSPPPEAESVTAESRTGIGGVIC